MYTGSCLCGGIRFEVDAELGPIDICHCRQCRKAQGTAFATNAPVAAAALRIVSGSDLLKAYESSPGKHRHFCSRCGSPIYSRRDTKPDVVRIRVGVINEPLNVRPHAHYYTAWKCNWWDITDDLPRRAQE
jgi:hypothetical protein